MPAEVYTSMGGRSETLYCGYQCDDRLSWLIWNPEGNRPAFPVLPSAERAIYAGGRFWQHWRRGEKFYCRHRMRPQERLMPWNPDASLYIRALAVRGATIYAGGDFTSIGGQSRNYIAALDPTTGLVTDWNPNADGSVNVLMESGGIIYAGGYFTGIGGQWRGSIAALDATTGQATSWNPEGRRPRYASWKSGGIIYDGGIFYHIGGQPRNNIAALDAGMGQATNWNPDADRLVYALAKDGGLVYAGGGVPEHRRTSAAIARGSQHDRRRGYPRLGPESECQQREVYSLAVSNGSLYVGGFFWNIGGLSRANLASFDAGTGSLTYWNPHVVGEVQALALRQGILYAGGNIDSIGGNNSAWGAYTHFNFVQFGPGNFQADFDGDGETDVAAFHRYVRPSL